MCGSEPEFVQLVGATARVVTPFLCTACVGCAIQDRLVRLRLDLCVALMLAGQICFIAVVAGAVSVYFGMRRSTTTIIYSQPQVAPCFVLMRCCLCCKRAFVLPILLLCSTVPCLAGPVMCALVLCVGLNLARSRARIVDTASVDRSR